MIAESLNKKRYEALTSLRGFFIYGIALFHMGVMIGRPMKRILDPVYHLGGYFGDYFFFMLSGFLMCHVYRERIAAGNTKVTDFLVAKMKKIWPMFFVTNMIALLFLLQLGDARDDICLKNIIMSSLMLSTGWVENIYPYNYPAWFLCVLFLCYILFYYISKLFVRNKDVYYLLVIILLMVGYMIEIREPDIPFLFEGDGEGFLNFFGGVLLYDLILYIKKNRNSHLNVLRSACVIIIAGASILFTIYDINELCGDKRIVITFLLLPPLFFLATSEGFIQRVLELRPLVYLGELSMYIFLIHVPVIYAYLTINSYLGITVQPNVFLVSYIVIISVISVILRQAIGRKNWFCHR